MQNNVVLKDINADLNLTLVQYSANVAGSTWCSCWLLCSGCCCESLATNSAISLAGGALVSGREFVQLRAHKQLDNGAHFVTVTSVNYEPQPFSEGYVVRSRWSARCHHHRGHRAHTSHRRAGTARRRALGQLAHAHCRNA